jgi:hypothetical protein
MIKFVLDNLKLHILMYIIYKIKFLHGPTRLVIITLEYNFRSKISKGTLPQVQRSGFNILTLKVDDDIDSLS